MKLVEDRVEIDASASDHAERFDVEGRPRPKGMQLVDFVVEHGRRILLVEIKDPARTPEPHRERELDRFRRKFDSGALIHNELVPKARDSYTFLHLMARDDQPMVLVCLLVSNPPIDELLLLNFKERLLGRLRREAHEPWKRRYIEDCLVLDEDEWARVFPELPLRRIETKTS